MTSITKMDEVESRKETSSVEEDSMHVLGHAQYDAEASKRLVQRFDRRLVPLACWAYLIAYIDRANIGNAKVAGVTSTGLLAELDLTPNQFNISLVVFLVSYLVFGPPGNLVMKRVGPPKWLCFIMVTWGICTCCLGAVQTRGQLYTVRWLLGMAESSLFGGLVYTFTFYYRPEERSIRIALMLASATLAGAFGGALATGISALDGVRGLAAWRWIFILEGIPPILTGPVLYFLYPAFPEQAKWLSDEEKKLVAARLQGTNSSKSTDRAGWKEIKETFKERNLYLHYLLQFFMSLPFSSLSFFVPSIVQGFGYTGIDSNLFTVPPWGFAWFCCLLAAFIGDRYDRRGVVIVVCALIGTVAFAVEGALPGDSFGKRYGFLFIATGATFASFPLQSGWISSNARTTAIAAFAIPLNLSIGAIGQICGLFIYKADQKPLYPTGHYTNMASCALGAVCALGLLFVYFRRNRTIKRDNLDTTPWST